MMSCVLVTDGEQHSALAVVRSLGRAGHRVLVCSASPRSLAAASRWAVGEAVVPNPLGDPDRYVAALERVVARHRIQVILPVTDQAAMALLRSGASLAGAIIPGPDYPTFLRAADKAAVIAEAERHGIKAPEQRVATEPGQINRRLAEELSYPIVIKPARSVAGGRRHPVLYADTPDELLAVGARLEAEVYPLLLQRRIVGHGTGVFLLIWRGQLVASFAHRRLRELPPSGGRSVYCESVPMDAGLLERSRALLEGLKWQGVAMVEYKVDSTTGVPYLMEVNGRFWGSLQLAIDAGVDFPALLVAAALDLPLSRVSTYRTGIRLRSWWGDVEQLLARVHGPSGTLGRADGAPSRLRVLGEFLRWYPGERLETLRLSDPWPGLVETARWLRYRLFGRITGSRSGEVALPGVGGQP